MARYCLHEPTGIEKVVLRAMYCRLIRYSYDISKYFVSNKLDGVLGLEFLEGTASTQAQMLEFVVVGRGTVMVKEEVATYGSIYPVTGWSFAQLKMGLSPLKEIRPTQAPQNGFDQLFTNEKLLSDIDAVLSLLLRGGVIGKL